MITDEEARDIAESVEKGKPFSYVQAAHLLARYVLGGLARAAPSRGSEPPEGGASKEAHGPGVRPQAPAKPHPASPTSSGVPGTFIPGPSARDRAISEWLEGHAEGYAHAGQHEIADVLREKARGILEQEYLG